MHNRGPWVSTRATKRSGAGFIGFCAFWVECCSRLLAFTASSTTRLLESFQHTVLAKFWVLVSFFLPLQYGRTFGKENADLEIL